MRFAVLICLLAACGIAAPAVAQTEQPVPVPPAAVSPANPQQQDAKPSPSQPQTVQPPVQPPDQQPEAAPPQPLPDIHLPRSYRQAYSVDDRDGQSSAYIPMDSWVYPALDRLHSLGYLDTAFLGLRPWTRLSVLHMLDATRAPSQDPDSAGGREAEQLFLALEQEFGGDLYFTGEHAELDRVYTRFLYIRNPILNDSFHLGQTIINDYGRPYQPGINNVSGAEGRVEAGRLSLQVRAEFQHAPSAAGYSLPFATYLSQNIDNIPYDPSLHADTIPLGPIAGISNFRLLEATLSYHLFKHEISFGKSDHWLGPAQGGAFAWSTNADNVYAFQINRVEPMYVPLLRRVIGPLRYDFFVGSLQGHTQPESPYVHAEKVSIHPTPNLEMGFERTVIWGGLGHEPVNLKSFLRSFFSFSGVSQPKKEGPTDPGARFSSFDFSYRLPYLRNWLTLYTDSFAHDDVNPISAPRRAAVHPGIYLSHFPGAAKLDLRIEGANTDTLEASAGDFYYYEFIQKQGPTNKGFLYTDPIGRQNKGGQAWLTYHLSPQEQVQFSFRNVKAANSFIPGGTTQNEYRVDVVKRIQPNLEVHVAGQLESWMAPIYEPGHHKDGEIWGEVTWYPHKQRQLGGDPKFFSNGR